MVNNRVVAELKKGDTFGELALISDANRSASIRARQDSSLWGIDRNMFQNAI
jgi:CRP-like cAMP-binding protein